MYCEGGFRQLLMYYTRIHPKPDGKIQMGTRGLLKLGVFFGGEDLVYICAYAERKTYAYTYIYIHLYIQTLRTP